jgi:hypothetical protein
LFASGEQGAWYDPSDLSTLFQDSTGTTPVTAVGQPVGLMLDKSGRGNHAIQSTATARPTLQLDAWRYCLNFDGVDDYLKAATFPGGLPIWMAMGVSRANVVFSVCAGTGNGMRWETGSNGAMRTNNYGGGGVNVAAGIIANTNTPYVQGGFANTGQIGAFANGVATATVATTPLSGTAGLFIGCTESVSSMMQGRMYSGVFLSRLLSASEQSIAVRYIAARSGVTL